MQLYIFCMTLNFCFVIKILSSLFQFFCSEVRNLSFSVFISGLLYVREKYIDIQVTLKYIHFGFVSDTNQAESLMLFIQ